MAMWNQMERGQSVSARRGQASPDSVNVNDSVEGREDMDSLELVIEDVEETAATRRLDALAADDAAYAALTEGDATDRAATPLSAGMRRAQVRATIRQFLKATPRSEPEALLTIRSLDGEPHTVSRARLTGAIDGMRTRMRQVIRLGLEERWRREKIREYLRGVSIKTLERDQAEGLDHLASLFDLDD